MFKGVRLKTVQHVQSKLLKTINYKNFFFTTYIYIMYLYKKSNFWQVSRNKLSLYLPRMMHLAPSFKMHQSWPATLFLRVSHPSIHLPNSVYSSALKTGSKSDSMFSHVAKKSSVANTTFPPACRKKNTFDLLLCHEHYNNLYRILPRMLYAELCTT